MTIRVQAPRTLLLLLVGWMLVLAHPTVQTEAVRDTSPTSAVAPLAPALSAPAPLGPAPAGTGR